MGCLGRPVSRLTPSFKVGGVYFVTGSIYLGLLETLLHAGIDYQKNEGTYDFNVDQLLHLLCNVIWVILLWSGIIWS